MVLPLNSRRAKLIKRIPILYTLTLLRGLVCVCMGNLTPACTQNPNSNDKLCIYMIFSKLKQTSKH